MGSSDNVDGCNDWVKLSARKSSVFPDSEISAAFVEAKPEMQLPDMVEGCGQKAECVVDENRFRIVESEVRLDEGDGLICPDAGIG